LCDKRYGREKEKLIRVFPNTKAAFTRLEIFLENYSRNPKTDQLDSGLKLTNENWGNYIDPQDELENIENGTTAQ
jgi:hypothetical protein